MMRRNRHSGYLSWAVIALGTILLGILIGVNYSRDRDRISYDRSGQVSQPWGILSEDEFQDIRRKLGSAQIPPKNDIAPTPQVHLRQTTEEIMLVPYEDIKITDNGYGMQVVEKTVREEEIDGTLIWTI